jgi:hypothetical protein
MNLTQYGNSTYKSDVQDIALTMNALRASQVKPVDVSLAEFIDKKYGGLSMESFYQDLGVDPTMDTIQNLLTLPDASIRFLYPELIRDALRLGLRRSAIWPNLIVAEQTVPNPTVVQPWINMSDAAPKLVGEAETISTGSVSYGSKTLTLAKMGKGIKVTDEVRRYVSINLVSIFFQDFGIKLGQGLDTLLITTLINGEQSSGAESAPVVGVATTGTTTYRDMLKVWIRMSRIGRKADSIIGGEDAALDTLDLAEFKNRQNAGPTYANLDLKTPLPKNANYYIHGNVPTDQQIIIDSNSTIIKYNSQALLLETERMVSNQTEATYATLTTGFGIVYRDGRVILDQSLDIATNDFPSYMDVDTLDNVIIN